jgi:hypothetical protein
MKVVFTKPFEFEGKEYKEIELGLEGLNGKDLIDASKEARPMGETSPVSELSKTYLAVVAAKSAKVPVDLIVGLPGKDFSRVTLAVQNFLLE